MRTIHKLAGGLAALALASAVPAAAADLAGAEKIRRLDIMLMVTSLRCRSGESDFQGEFHAFEAAHLAELNGAASTLRASFAGRLGAKGAAAEIDRISTSIANEYGAGHPWLGCHQLRQITHSLAETEGPEALVAAADELMGGDGPRLAYGGQ